MANINTLTLMGTVTEVDQLRYSGKLAVLGFEFVVKKFWKDKNGVQCREHIFPVTIFGERAEKANGELRPGRQVVLEGELSSREKEAKQTGKAYLVLEIKVDKMQIL